MSKHGQPMSQTLAEMQMNELKMNDPKLNKIFDKLKKGDKIKLKTSSTMSRGSDFVEYIVKSKNVVNKGRVEKITLATVGNEGAVKKFLYRRDGKVTFAMGDMAASIDDIKEKYSLINHEIVEAIDPADVDDDATDADKKAADKNIIMQMRKAMDVKGNMKIEFGDGKKEKVDPKILDMMTKAHMKIQKPRDKEKFVAMISKSKRDMLNVAKKLSTLKMGEELKLDEGTWKYADTPKEIATLKKLMSRPIPIGSDEDEDTYKDSAQSKLYGLLGDDELFDALGVLQDKGNPKADARPTIIKWFQKRVKDDSYGLGDETKELGKKIGLKMEYVPEGFSPKQIKMAIGIASDPRYKGGNYTGAFNAIEKIKKGLASHPQVAAVLKRQNENLEEKYDLYHKTFSDAMQHAYDYAKKKLGITVDPKEIDNKVATGPRKPSEGKTNKYRLKGKGGNLQIQVYNKGGSKPFELNMYKEENEMEKSLKDTILEMRKEGFASDAQRKAAFASGYKEKGKKDKKEGVEEVDFFKGRTKDMTTEDKEAYEKFFQSALKKFGVKSPADFKSDEEKKKFFNYVDKNYKGENETNETVQRYHETKQGSLRESILKMWGEINEKVEYVEYKFKNERDAKAAKAYFDGIQLMSFDVNDDNIRGGELMVDAGSKDMTKYHKEVMKKFRPKVMTQEKKDLTNEKKDDTKKMTDTGKEVTPVELSVKMPKIKETKNKV